MTPDEYDDWCRKLARCPTADKVVWPTRALADLAVPVMVARAEQAGLDVGDPGSYRCEHQYGCHLFHLTRDLDRVNHPSRNQRQKHNQPGTYQEKVRRQRRNRRARDRQNRRGH